LDKGIDAINGVGKLVEGFAVTLDSVIGQAFEDWGTPKNATGNANRSIRSRDMPSSRSTHRKTVAIGANHLVGSQNNAAKEEWGDFDVDNESDFADENTSPQAPNEPNVLFTKTTGVSTQATNGQRNKDKAGRDEVMQWRRRAQILHKELQRLRGHQEQNKKLRYVGHLVVPRTHPVLVFLSVPPMNDVLPSD
jgi:hypothetical protein